MLSAVSSSNRSSCDHANELIEKRLSGISSGPKSLSFPSRRQTSPGNVDLGDGWSKPTYGDWLLEKSAHVDWTMLPHGDWLLEKLGLW